MTDDLLVSVIVPVRDSPDDVREVTARLAGQTLPRDCFEVIIADDGSFDDLSRPSGVDGRWLRVTRGTRANSYAARNRAARLARGRTLAFTDVDCRPRPDWLERGVAELQGADLVAGHIDLRVPDRPSVWAILDVLLFDQQRFVAMGKAATANLFMARALFERHGGFDESLPSGGDWDLVERCVRDGASLRYSPAAVVEHPVRSRGREFLGRRWRIEQAMAMRSRQTRRSLLSFNRSREAVVPRRWGFAVGYDRQRLAALRIADGWPTRLSTAPARYVIVPAVDVTAQAAGWLRARVVARGG